jgi:hypothetical protein
VTEGHTLFVLWFDPSQRSIVPVARLVHRHEAEGDVYEFRYVRGALDASARGFLPFLAFPDLHQVYLSRELFPFFANRVMPSTRPDYLEYVETLGLSRAQADSMAILARSGGTRETDRIELCAMPARDERSGAYTAYFLAMPYMDTPWSCRRRRHEGHRGRRWRGIGSRSSWADGPHRHDKR